MIGIKKMTLEDLTFPFKTALEGNKGKAQHILNAKIAWFKKQGLNEEANVLDAFRIGLRKKRF